MTKSTHSLCHTTESRDTELKHTTMRMNTTCHLATDYTGKRRKKKKKRKKRGSDKSFNNTPIHLGTGFSSIWLKSYSSLIPSVQKRIHSVRSQEHTASHPHSQLNCLNQKPSRPQVSVTAHSKQEVPSEHTSLPLSTAPQATRFKILQIPPKWHRPATEHPSAPLPKKRLYFKANVTI